MEKNESFGSVHLNGEDHEINTENTSLYTYLGRLAMYNHVWVSLNEDQGVRLFDTIPQTHDAYEALRPAVIENECVLIMNLREVSEADASSYARMACMDLEERPDWL